MFAYTVGGPEPGSAGTGALNQTLSFLLYLGPSSAASCLARPDMNSKLMTRSICIASVLASGMSLILPSIANDKQAEKTTEKPQFIDPAIPPQLDRSGQPRQGIASYYADRFSGRTMADGTAMNPDANIAASRTLPLGTRAEIINLENGKRAEVEIRDRGPYIEGRIVDVSPKVARDLDIVEQGLASVEVRPIEIPQREGSSKQIMSGASIDEKTANSEP